MMKKTLILLLCAISLWVSLIAKAQDTLYIYQSGLVKEKSAISEIDSIAFKMGPLILGRISDIEGNEYLTVQIGTQTWMAENLRTLTFSNGTPIPKVTGDSDWGNLTTPAFVGMTMIPPPMAH